MSSHSAEQSVNRGRLLAPRPPLLVAPRSTSAASSSTPSQERELPNLDPVSPCQAPRMQIAAVRRVGASPDRKQRHAASRPSCCCSRREGENHRPGRHCKNGDPPVHLPFLLILLALLLSPRAALAQFDTPEQERSVLEVFYRSTSGPTWLNNNNWLDPGSPHCTWHGIGCDDEGRVNDIFLVGMGLSGVTPPELWSLSRLARFTVSSNAELVVQFRRDLSVPPPELVYVDVSGTATVDASQIETFPFVRHLDMSLTNVTAASLVSHVFAMTTLETLYLANTTAAFSLGRLTGAPLARRGSLRELRMPNSALSGTIPTDIGRFVSLDLSNTRLTGTIPGYRIDELHMLEYFDLHSCQLAGRVPDFASQAFLRYIDLSDNYLSGEVPPGLLANADVQPRIHVDLSDNLLVGTLINDLARFERLDIDVTGNMISGVDDEICDRTEWNGGTVGTFGCDAVLCPPDTYNEFGRQVSADDPCLPCDDVSEFYGGTSCPYFGGGGQTWPTLPPVPVMPAPTPSPNNPRLCDPDCERDMLTVLWRSTSGSNWFNSANWLDVDIPHCTWFGIGCDEDGFVRSIELAQNNLSGFILPELWRLSRLVRVVFRDNAELEVRFRHFGVASPLEYVDVAGTGAVDAFQIEEFPSLSYLDVSRTSISDVFLVKHVFGTTSLTSLDISNTTAVFSLSRLTASPLLGLQALNMANSGIQGTIPNEIDKFTDLVTLDLSNTGLVGTIPDYSIEKLQELRSFDAHSCRLEGGVPQFAGNGFLRTVDLSDNYLVGPLPPNLLPEVRSRIEVDLSDNLLEGPLIVNDPGRFWRLDVTGNMISGIDDEICNQGEWYGGTVATFGCDAVLCPPGSFNEFGRQVSADDPCLPCDDAEFFGSITCPYDGSKAWPSPPSVPLDSTPSDLPCDLECMNGGVCVNDELDELLGVKMLCLCPEGYRGYQCEHAAVQCNGLTCLNGGVCIGGDFAVDSDEEAPPTFEAPDNVQICDCSRAYVRRMPTAGLQCEHVATVICQPEVSNGVITSFCTNEGSCISLVEAGKPHAGCDCPDGFSGAFCEYLAPKPVENDGSYVDIQPTILCPDGHRCNNGGICTESPSDEGSYYCNCDNATIEGLPSAGIYCEQIGTTLCSRTWILGQPTPFCANEGQCLALVDSYEDGHPGCDCPSNWEGDKCQFAVGSEFPPFPQEEVQEQDELTCPDGSTCLNNGICTPDPDVAGSYYCYCSFSDAPSIPFAGIRCEYRATSICTVGNPHTSFCTNDGLCLEIVEPGRVHQGCQCPTGFEGAFCQYIVGMDNPDSSSDGTANAVVQSGGTNDASVGNGLEAGQIALAVCLPVLALIAGLMAFFVLKRRRPADLRASNSEDLQGAEAAASSVSPITTAKNEKQSSTRDSNEIEEGMAVATQGDEGDDVEVQLSFEKADTVEEEKEEVEAVAIEENHPIKDAEEVEAEDEEEEVGGESTESSVQVSDDQDSTSRSST